MPYKFIQIVVRVVMFYDTIWWIWSILLFSNTDLIYKNITIKDWNMIDYKYTTYLS